MFSGTESRHFVPVRLFLAQYSCVHSRCSSYTYIILKILFEINKQKHNNNNTAKHTTTTTTTKTKTNKKIKNKQTNKQNHTKIQTTTIKQNNKQTKTNNVLCIKVASLEMSYKNQKFLSIFYGQRNQRK